MSSNLRNKALLFTELRLLQGTYKQLHFYVTSTRQAQTVAL